MVLLMVGACASSDVVDESAGSTQQGVTEGNEASTTASGIPKAREMEYPPTSGLPQPGASEAGQLPEPTPRRAAPWCPEKRRSDPDWQATEKAQRQDKESQEAKAPVSIPNIPPAPAEYAAKQQRFLKAVEAMRAELDALPPEERERKYDQTKTEFLGD